MSDKLQKKVNPVSITLAPVVTTTVSITMPLETAKYLLDVLRTVGGELDGPRGKITDIIRALEDSGIVLNKSQTAGTVYFHENS